MPAERTAAVPLEFEGDVISYEISGNREGIWTACVGRLYAKSGPSCFVVQNGKSRFPPDRVR